MRHIEQYPDESGDLPPGPLPRVEEFEKHPEFLEAIFGMADIFSRAGDVDSALDRLQANDIDGFYAAVGITPAEGEVLIHKLDTARRQENESREEYETRIYGRVLTAEELYQQTKYYEKIYSAAGIDQSKLPDMLSHKYDQLRQRRSAEVKAEIDELLSQNPTHTLKYTGHPRQQDFERAVGGMVLDDGSEVDIIREVHQEFGPRYDIVVAYPADADDFVVTESYNLNADLYWYEKARPSKLPGATEGEVVKRKLEESDFRRIDELLEHYGSKAS